MQRQISRHSTTLLAVAPTLLVAGSPLPVGVSIPLWLLRDGQWSQSNNTSIETRTGSGEPATCSVDATASSFKAAISSFASNSEPTDSGLRAAVSGL